MIDLQNAQIYIIESENTEDVYIGATCNGLNRRMREHRLLYKCWQGGKGRKVMSYDILSKGGATIRLLENFPCETKKELNERERWYIKNTPNCINKCC